MRKRVGVALIAALVVVVPACSSGEKVGSGIDVNKLNEKARRLGELESTKKKQTGGGGFVGQQEQQAAAKKQAEQQQKAQAELKKQAEQESAVNVAVTSSGFDPYYIRVFQGGIVQVTNKDSKPRTVTADKGEFDSGTIQPGGKWTYSADTIGKFNFHDDTRPFVVGTLEVLAG